VVPWLLRYPGSSPRPQETANASRSPSSLHGGDRNERATPDRLSRRGTVELKPSIRITARAYVWAVEGSKPMVRLAMPCRFCLIAVLMAAEPGQDGPELRQRANRQNRNVRGKRLPESDAGVLHRGYWLDPVKDEPVIFPPTTRRKRTAATRSSAGCTAAGAISGPAATGPNGSTPPVPSRSIRSLPT
jgi:hypothetical protein